MKTCYTIVVEGRLDPCWASELGASRVQARGDGTTAVVSELRDQSELHGQIRRIEGLGLKLVSVNEVGVAR